MDLPDTQRKYYKGLSYQLSNILEFDYYDDYVIQDNAQTYTNYELGLHFSVEQFSRDEADVLTYLFDEEIDRLNAVHDNYVIQRQNSLLKYAVAIKKELPKSVMYHGYIQVIQGDEYSDQLGVTYMTATMEIDGEYFVFQMIGKRDNMGYLYDDFIDILSSVRS